MRCDCEVPVHGVADPGQNERVADLFIPPAPCEINVRHIVVTEHISAGQHTRYAGAVHIRYLDHIVSGSDCVDDVLRRRIAAFHEKFPDFDVECFVCLRDGVVLRVVQRFTGQLFHHDRIACVRVVDHAEGKGFSAEIEIGRQVWHFLRLHALGFAFGFIDGGGGVRCVVRLCGAGNEHSDKQQ